MSVRISGHGDPRAAADVTYRTFKAVGAVAAGDPLVFVTSDNTLAGLIVSADTAGTSPVAGVATEAVASGEYVRAVVSGRVETKNVSGGSASAGTYVNDNTVLFMETTADDAIGTAIVSGFGR